MGYFGIFDKRNCEWFHPSLCYESLKNKICTRSQCKFHHIKGTKQGAEKTKQKNNVEAKKIKNKEDSFLELAKTLTSFQQTIERMQQDQKYLMSTLQQKNLIPIKPAQAHPGQPIYLSYT